ncbi:flagellar basal-body rod protein FlgF [Pseudohoeflea coraliihabitans]|uniref:Flagellar basal-body rod protein FlgF n=1 Tax=Pseudohoeflea coraliihabitans TaxID=2860393 RepID=A0ABS6WPS9_9HYPH|nr:flagellar basal-body rod protein FlgF [Pseudohoeflea sp. DP4N28-3]MBW3097377.1 flagellar basal-body rod protein FlgF [Pseudohoeflea sp. DP4N28-3]
MESSLYVSMSAQLALERRLTTIADNVANANTVGFRATKLTFGEMVSSLGADDVSYVSRGEDFLSTISGGLRQTGNAFDFAINGDAWFQVETPTGQILTRDGRFSMSAEGELVTLAGHPVLDVGGAPIQLNPAAGAPEVGKDGGIYQDGRRAGQLGLFTADFSQGFQRVGSLGVLSAIDPEPVVDRTDVGVTQGYLEDSNVNPVSEMTRLIMVSRAFENTSIMMRDSEASLKEAIKVLGSGR